MVWPVGPDMENLQDLSSEDLAILKAECSGREVFNHLTSRWGLLAIVALSRGPHRFYMLRDSIGGISEKMLSQTMLTLTRDGLVHRTVDPTIPPKVTYSLTPLGQEIAPRLRTITEWIGNRIEVISEAQTRFDTDRD